MVWDRVRAVKEQVEASLLRKKHVVGVGIAKKVVGGEETDEPCVVVFVEKKVPPSKLRKKDRVPETVAGVKTDVVETGEIRALDAPVEEEIGRTERWRPAPGGVSIGHVRVTAGTLGGVVRRNGDRVILSNNHVLANSNDAAPGDGILQPGPADGGGPADRLATLERFVPIAFEEPLSLLRRFWRTLLRLLRLGGGEDGQTSDNLVDAAIARPVRGEDVSAEVLEIGPFLGSAAAAVGTRIRKSGRSSGLTNGVIAAIGVTVRVRYGVRVATFREQLLAGPMSQPGDSGSLAVDDANRAVGLLFAGSDRSTVFNPIAAVRDSLGIEI